jgi:ABC-type oligopeptide transport system substrate-binding subunit
MSKYKEYFNHPKNYKEREDMGSLVFSPPTNSTYPLGLFKSGEYDIRTLISTNNIFHKYQLSYPSLLTRWISG